MAKKLTKDEALKILTANAGVSIKGNIIVFEKDKFTGFKGLQSCSAYDALKNHYGYK